VEASGVFGSWIRRRLNCLSISLRIWVVLTLGLAIFGYLYPWSHTVSDIYVRAARSWWTGTDMYAARGTDYYRYSPLFAIVFTPFALLPDSLGNAAWRIVNCLIYLGGLWSWITHVAPGFRTRRQLGAVLLLVLPVSLHSIYNAQANLLMLGAIMLGLANAANQRWNRAAAWLALATLIKGYPLALAMLLTAFHPRRFGPRFLSALSLGLLLPFLFQSPEVAWGQYTSWLSHLRTSPDIMRERVRSLDYLFDLYGHPLASHTFGVIQVFAGLGVLALCVVHSWRTPDVRQQLLMEFLLFSVWVVLFGPATETCTYVVIAPALAWALVDAFSKQMFWGLRLLLIGSLLLMGPLASDLPGRTIRNFCNEHGCQPIGALLVLAYLITALLRSASPAESKGAATCPVRLDPVL
jgi:hypothetical protein